MGKEYRDKQTEFRMSNDLINSKYAMSSMAKDIMNLAITRLEETNDPDAPLHAVLYNIDVFKVLGTRKKTNISRELNKVSKELQECKLIIEDGKGGFDSFVIAPTCRYHNGVFVIEFNRAIRDHSLNLKTPYTTISLVSSSLLERFFSKRIYEILKEEYFRLNPKNLNECVKKRANLNALRFQLGMADQSEEAVDKYVKRCKREKKPIDWDYAYNELASNKKFERWDSFKARVLEPARLDIETVTELRFTYEAIRAAHNRVVEIEFSIYPNNPSPDIIALRKQRLDAVEQGESELFRQQDMTDYICRALINEYSDHEDIFGKEEIQLFMNDANNDEDLVRWAIDNIDEYGKNNVINNYIGGVRDRIRHPENYKSPVVVVNGDVEKGKQLVEIIENYEEHKDETAVRVWEKAKSKPEFKLFEDYLNNRLSMQLSDFEDLYDYKERFSEYLDWKRNNLV